MTRTERHPRPIRRRSGVNTALREVWAAPRPAAKQSPRRPPTRLRGLRKIDIRNCHVDRTGIWPQAERTKTR
jgi:hypothetical protein